MAEAAAAGARRPVILALLDYYLPGVRAGGPVRSVQHLGERLGGEFEVRVLTRDHDPGIAAPYGLADSGRWHRVDATTVRYLGPRALRPRGLRRAIRATAHEVLYLNSFFSPRFTFIPLLLRRAGALPPRPVVLAPRGELHPGALGTGAWPRWVPGALARVVRPPRVLKKLVYIRFCRAAGLLHGVLWQASGPEEERDIRRHIGRGARVMVAPDLGPATPSRPVPPRPKQPGRLEVVFLSRLVAKKNLLEAIGILRQVRAEVEFRIYGPAEDQAYWEECRRALGTLPANVRARYQGPVLHSRVPEVFRRHHLLFLPTRGENFGHVILEALAEGCPVLISDQTPWRRLERHQAGWDLPLDRPDAFREAVERCAAMDADAYARLSRGAAEFARRYLADPGPEEMNRALFAAALGAAPALPGAARAVRADAALQAHARMHGRAARRDPARALAAGAGIPPADGGGEPGS